MRVKLRCGVNYAKISFKILGIDFVINEPKTVIVLATGVSTTNISE